MEGSCQTHEIDMVSNVELSIVGVQGLLPAQSVKGIRVRTHQLLKAKKNDKKPRTINMSTIERERYIISEIGTKTTTELARDLHVSRRVIYDTCKNYGVEITSMWKPRKKELIKNGYPSGKDEAVRTLLPHITENERKDLLVVNETATVNMSIEERNRYIIANIKTKTPDVLAEDLNISVNDVLNICTREVSIELYRRKKVGWKNKSRNKGKKRARLTL